MRNKNFEGAFQGEARFIHPALYVHGISFLIASGVGKPPVPWIVPITEIPYVFSDVFPIAQDKKGLFDRAALSHSVKYRFGKIPWASRRLDFWKVVRTIFLEGYGGLSECALYQGVPAASNERIVVKVEDPALGVCTWLCKKRWWHH